MITPTVANPEQIKVETSPYSTTLGLNPPVSTAVVRPDLNGIRVRSPADPKIYLIDRGVKRWIPNPETYNNLFANWDNVIVSIEVNEITSGPDITNGAVLARPSGQAPIYLLDQNQKRHIQSPATMAKYSFNGGRVYQIPPAIMDSIYTGDEIS
jgi:hypothetical protein